MLVISAVAGTVDVAAISPQLAVIGKFAGVFALLGAFVGIAYAIHPVEVSHLWDRPIVRTLLAVGVAVTLVVAVHFSPFAAVILVAAFGLLSWLGSSVRLRRMKAETRK